MECLGSVSEKLQGLDRDRDMQGNISTTVSPVSVYDPVTSKQQFGVRGFLAVA